MKKRSKYSNCSYNLLTFPIQRDKKIQSHVSLKRDEYLHLNSRTILAGFIFYLIQRVSLISANVLGTSQSSIILFRFLNLYRRKIWIAVIRPAIDIVFLFLRFLSLLPRKSFSCFQYAVMDFFFRALKNRIFIRKSRKMSLYSSQAIEPQFHRTIPFKIDALPNLNGSSYLYCIVVTFHQSLVQLFHLYTFSIDVLTTHYVM